MPDKKDISDEIFLVPGIVTAWKEAAQTALRLLKPVDHSEIGEEIITLNPDGKTLTVSCTVGKSVVSMHIPKEGWSRIGWAQ